MSAASLFPDPPSAGPHQDFGRTLPGPLASPADPPTSVEAGERHLKSGKLGANATIVLRLVRMYPRMTAVELFHAQGDMGAMQRHEVSRRLPDLEKAGLVRKGDARPCEYPPNHSMVTWWPVEGNNDGPA